MEMTTIDGSKTTSSENQLNLWYAWRTRDIATFSKLITDGVDKKVIEALLLNIISDFTQAGKQFATAVFKSKAHEKTFENGKSLMRHIVECGNWPILELFLSYDPNMRETDEDDGNTSLHYLCQIDWGDKRETFKKCMTTLIAQSETDVNALNKLQLTPIDLAIEVGNKEAVEILLKNSSWIYIDGVVQGRPTTRQRLLKKYPDLKEDLPPVTENRITTSALWSLLDRKDEAEFCAQFQIAIQVDSLKPILSKKINIFLQRACTYKLKNAIKLLMDYGADPSFIDKWNNSRSSIIIAVEKGYLDILPLLLERATIPKFKSEPGKLVDVNKQDDKGNTALHYAALYGNESAMIEILKFGGYMGIENKRGQIPLRKIPETVLKHFLDRNIKSNKQDSFGQDQLTFKYSFLKKPSIPEYRTEEYWYSESLSLQSSNSETTIEINTQDTSFKPDMKIVREISKMSELQSLILHPILSSFILLKWQLLKPIFLNNLIFHAALTALITFNILWTSITDGNILLPMRILQGILILVLLLSQIIQTLINTKSYIYQLENYLALPLIFVVGYLTIIDCSEMTACRHMGAAAILISWFDFLLLIGKHPQFSVQVKMFLLMFVTFVKFLSIYFIIIMAFALSFFILFHDCLPSDCPSNSFSDIGQSIFKTLSMISGEFDAKDSPFYVTPGTSHVIFLLFVFLAALVFINLIIGLAVSDMEKIKENALLHSYLSRVKYLTALEELLIGLKSKWGFKKISNYFLDFDDTFSTAKNDNNSNCFKSYRMDPDVLQKAREILKSVENEEIVKKAEKRQQDNLADHRSEVVHQLGNSVKTLNEEANFDSITQRLDKIEVTMQRLDKIEVILQRMDRIVGVTQRQCKIETEIN